MRLATVVTAPDGRGYWYRDVELAVVPVRFDVVVFGDGRAEGIVRLVRHLVAPEHAWPGFPHGPVVEVWIADRHLGESAPDLEHAKAWLLRDGWVFSHAKLPRPPPEPPT